MPGTPPPRPHAAPPPNSYWVLPGQLLAGEYPGASSLAATRERLRSLLRAGVGCFIDLTEPGELAPYDAGLPHGVEYFRWPLPDHGIPERPAQMTGVLECLRAALRSSHGVYLHCRAGIGRTNMVVGCLLVERGLGGEAALAELNRLWQASDRAALWPEVPETPAQADYVRRWVRPGGAPPDP
jgi:hypothetical protein